MPSDNCYNSLIQMLHCSSCNGFLNVKVCNNYCLNVMKECLLYHTEVDGEWNSFVGKHEYKYIIFLKELHYCYDSSLLTISFLRGRHFLCKYILLFQVLWEKQEWFVECLIHSVNSFCDSPAVELSECSGGIGFWRLVLYLLMMVGSTAYIFFFTLISED